MLSPRLTSTGREAAMVDCDVEEVLFEIGAEVIANLKGCVLIAWLLSYNYIYIKLKGGE